MRTLMVIAALLVAGCTAQPQNPDIATALESRKQALITEVVAGRISPAEAQARMDEARMAATSEEQRRFYQGRPVVVPMIRPLVCRQDFGTMICN
jgi:hypothetical protein